MVIGKEGKTIKQLRISSGANIRVVNVRCRSSRLRLRQRPPLLLWWQCRTRSPLTINSNFI